MTPNNGSEIKQEKKIGTTRKLSKKPKDEVKYIIKIIRVITKTQKQLEWKKVTDEIGTGKDQYRDVLREVRVKEEVTMFETVTDTMISLVDLTTLIED